MTTTLDTTNIPTPSASSAAAYDELTPMPPALLRAHPANPRTSLGDLDDLAASLQASGVLEPIVAVPAATVAAAWPDHADTVAGATYITLLGHRRAAAAIQAGLDTVPVVVRHDLDTATAQLGAMAAENIARADLSPMDEARTFARLAEQGWSQRRIAGELGCAQSHVSKRLMFLTVPDDVAAAVTDGDLDVSAALTIAKLNDPALMDQAWQQIQPELSADWFDKTTVEDIVEDIRRDAAEAAAKQAQLEQAAREGIRVIDGAFKEFGHTSWEHRLDNDQQTEAARANGTLVYTLGYESLVPYTTQPPKKPKKEQEAEDARVVEERMRKISVRARQDFLTSTYLAIQPGPEQLHQALTDAVLKGRYPDRTTLKLAGRWMHDAGVVPPMHPDKYIAWAGQHPDPATRDHLAWAGMVTADEQDARDPHIRRWGPRVTGHLHRLIDAGYQPTPWEKERLANARDHEELCGDLDCTRTTWHLDDCEYAEPADSTESPEQDIASKAGR